MKALEINDTVIYNGTLAIGKVTLDKPTGKIIEINDSFANIKWNGLEKDSQNTSWLNLNDLKLV